MHMAVLSFDQLITGLADTPLSLVDMAVLQASIATLHNATACIALIEQGALGRGCPLP